MPGKDIDSTPHHHLQQLQGGDDHGQHLGHRDPEQGHQVLYNMLVALLHSLGSIVAVHDGVHAVVHHHEPATGGCELYIGVPSKPQHSHMVVPTCQHIRSSHSQHPMLIRLLARVLEIANKVCKRGLLNLLGLKCLLNIFFDSAPVP